MLNKLKPQIRFNGYNDIWENDSLNTIFKINAGGDIGDIKYSLHKNQKNMYPIYSNGDKLGGLYGYCDTFKEIAPLITVSGRGTIGNAKVRLENFTPIIRLLVLKPNFKIDVNFFEAAINRINFFCESTGVPQLTSPQLGIYKVIYPSLLEQQKIGNLLSKVDTYINKQEELLKLLEEQKKGYMQKIFNREYRFKDEDGNYYPEWEEKKLGEVAECLDNKRVPLNTNERFLVQGDIPYYGANGIQGYINDYIFDEELLLIAEDGGNFHEYSTKGIAQYVTGKSWVNNHAHVLTSECTKFLYYKINNMNILNHINGTSRLKLNKSDLLLIKILVPTLKEQVLIKDLLSKQDEVIDSVSNNLKNLLKIKNGLLQKLYC